MIGVFQRVAAILVAQGHQEGFLSQDRLGFSRDRRRIHPDRIEGRGPDRFLEFDLRIEDFKAEEDPRGTDHQGQRPDIVDIEHHDRDRADVHDTGEEALIVAAAGRDGEKAVSHHDAAHQQHQREAFDGSASRLSPDQIGTGVQRRNQHPADDGGEPKGVRNQKVADRHEGHADQRHPDHPCARDLASLRPVLGAVRANHLGGKSDVAGALRQQALRLGFESRRHGHARPLVERCRAQSAGTRFQGFFLLPSVCLPHGSE